MKTWLLERAGVACLTVSAWLTALAQALYELAVRLVVRARPIPAPAAPRVEWPAHVPRIDVGLDDPDRTLTATVTELPRTRATLYWSPDGVLHFDQIQRGGGLA